MEPQDTALRDLTLRVRRLELKEARNRPASGVTVGDPGGYFGGPGGLTLEEVLELIGSGVLPEGFLRSSGGEVHVIDSSHATLTDTATFDLNNGNVHPGTLTEDCLITTTGWTAGKRCVLQWSLEGDGSSTPSFAGVTWVNGAPGIIDAGDVLHGLLWSDDGGTTIWGNFPGDTGALAEDVWMPLTTVVGGDPELVWDAEDSLIPTLVPI